VELASPFEAVSDILTRAKGIQVLTSLKATQTGERLDRLRKLASMPPEQAKGVGVDRRAEVFAMGVVLWELLVGKRLFKASNLAHNPYR
jgi:hypothetical protein